MAGKKDKKIVESAELPTDVQKQVAFQKRVANANADIGKVLKKYELAIKPQIVYRPEGIFPTATLVDTNNAEEKANKPA